MLMKDEDSNVVTFPGVAASAADGEGVAEPGGAEEATRAGEGPSGGDFAAKDGVPQYWFEERARNFWTQNRAGRWICTNEKNFRLYLRSIGLKSSVDFKAGEVISEVDECIHEVEWNRRVWYAGPLAGYQAGIHGMEGEDVLVTRSADLVEPKEGDWPVLRQLIDNLFCPDGSDEEAHKTTDDQREFVFAWLQHTLRALYTNVWSTQGLCLSIAGDPRCGKSLFADILKVLMGRKVARPYRYMIGRDNFNEEMFEAPLLLIDDESAATDIRARKEFAAQIKQIVANSGARCRGLHQKAVTLKPLWRLVVLLNLEPDNLMILPPLDEDIVDKMLVLKAYKRPMPMPADAEDEKRVFWQTLMSELPGFVWWLLNQYQMPSCLSGRFGVKHFAHPYIREQLEEMSPQMRLHEFMERRLYDARPFWSGTPAELEAFLKGEDSGLTLDERRKVWQAAWIGRYLKKLQDKFGESRFKLDRPGGTKRLWTCWSEDGVNTPEWIHWDRNGRKPISSPMGI